MDAASLVHAGSTLREIVDAKAITAHYQPIVDLGTQQVVAVEALARGPVGFFHYPRELFAAAEREGLSTELEWLCREAALQGAVGRLPDGVSLFVNVEPRELGTVPPPHVGQLEARARSAMAVVLELTERDLVRSPADVLAAVYAARNNGWGIALDDVGVDPASLALMPLVRPDVVKLDMQFVHRSPGRHAARVASAVASYAEESGASVLAEGIENAEHLERAIALGATLGQGFLFGRPRPLAAPFDLGDVRPLDLLDEQVRRLDSTPFELVGRRLPTRIARKSQLLAMSHHLERQTGDLPMPPLLMAAFEDAPHFTARTADRYRRYAHRSCLVAAFATGLSSEPTEGVRGAALDPNDPLAREWTVIVLSPHFAAALIARDLGDPGRDSDRRFEFALTHDRAHVTAAARCLAERISISAA